MQAWICDHCGDTIETKVVTAVTFHDASHDPMHRVQTLTTLHVCTKCTEELKDKWLAHNS